MNKSDAGFTAAQTGSLPGLLGFDWIDVRAGFARAGSTSVSSIWP